MLQHSCQIPEAINMFFRLKNSEERFSILCNASRYQQSKMADHKPEILISQSACNIAAQFQRLYPCFHDPEIQRNNSLVCVMQADGRNPRWRLNNKKYSCLWAAILDFWLIVHHTLLKIAPMSSLSSKTWVLPLEFCSYDVYTLRCKYFRFIGRHFKFLMFACIEHYREQRYSNL